MSPFRHASLHVRARESHTRVLFSRLERLRTNLLCCEPAKKKNSRLFVTVSWVLKMGYCVYRYLSCRLLGSRSCQRPLVRPSSNMALSKLSCKLCGLEYAADQGRLRGKVFTCTSCSNHVRLLQRNLGENTGLNNFTADQQKEFFQEILKKKKAAPNGRIHWQTVRAALVQAETSRSMQSFKSEVSGKQLPLSVWLQQGWSEDTVRRCPSEMSAELGCEVFMVPVKEMTWGEHFERCQKQILRHEQEAHKKKGKAKGTGTGGDAGDDSDLDLPQPPPPAGSAKDKAAKPESEKKALARRQKLFRQNEAEANRAAKAMGPLQNNLSALTKSWDKLGKSSADVPEAVSDLVKELLTRLQSWTEACRATVNDHEASRKLWEGLGGDLLPLKPLPFSAEDTKITLGQVAEAKKAVGDLIPKKPKGAGKGKKNKSADQASSANANGTSAETTEEPAAKKRRQGKTPA